MRKILETIISYTDSNTEFIHLVLVYITFMAYFFPPIRPHLCSLNKLNLTVVH